MNCVPRTRKSKVPAWRGLFRFGLFLAALFPVFCGWLEAQAPPTATTGGEIRGVVRSASTPIPGATVSATRTLTGQKVVTSSELNGSYELRLPADGRYVVRAQMAAFAPATQEVLINATNRSARADLELILLSRTRPAGQETSPEAAALGARGSQSLSVLQGEAGSETPTNGEQVAPAGMPVPGLAADSPSESIAVSGTAASQEFPALNAEELRQRIQEAREQQGFPPGGAGGGFPGGGGPAGGGPGGGPMVLLGRGRGRFDINRPHGAVFYTLGDSALDAAPYSLTGTPTAKPGYAQNRFGAVLGGPLNIPKIYRGGTKTFFFLAYNGSRADNPYDAFSTVPTLAERNGDFSQTRILSSPPVQIFDPQTGQPFPNNIIPPERLNAAATGLLRFIPLPNLPGDVQNLHYVTATTSNADNFNLRIVRTLGAASAGPRRGAPRNNLNIGFNFRNSENTLTNPFPTVTGRTSVRGIDIPMGYARTFGKLTNIFRFDFNRNRISTRNLYAFQENIAAEFGINGVSSDPFDWGLPSLSFTHFSSLRDINPLLRRDQTLSFSDFLILTRGRHTLRCGGDFRRIQLNTITDSNARGSFIFTGLNTAAFAGGLPVRGTGFDLADFLLGLPQQTSVQFGTTSYHFRGLSWALFVQEEWRVRGNLTLNLGLRYEYLSPFTEVGDRIVNLDVAPGFTAAAPVLPGGTGPWSGAFPASLVRPDRNNLAPRLGIAWKPRAKMVVRAGYGINYNTGQYASIVQQLAYQPPFSLTQTNIESPTLSLTLQNGFPPTPPLTVTNNFGVDRNYRLGYVQIWNLDLQYELRPGLILNLDYTGTKGTRLDILEAPNRAPNGLRIAGVQPFLWDTSDGNSIAHAGMLRLRKRLQRGLSIGGSYTFSKSIDNASTIGGGGTVVAQDAFDLAAERGLSSFDQRHRFSADYLWELPLGHDRRWLTQKGLAQNLLGDWQWSGDWTIASGTPFTARVLGDFADVNRGTNGTLRADATGQPLALENPGVAEWFNTSAFAVPPSGRFGNAARNTIRGPGTIVFNMALAKIIPIGDSKTLEIRGQANNIFNTPRFTAVDTVVNSPSFGRVVRVSSMRKVQIITRFRF